MGHAPRTVHLDQLALPASSGWRRLPLIGAALAVIGIGGSLALRGSQPEQFAFSWLVAFAYFLSIALGALFFVLVHYCTKSGWGVVVRRLAEDTMATLPVFALLFVPVALGLHELFHWSHVDAVAHDPLLQSKEPFLNTRFFLIRAAIYFLCWSAIAFWFQRASLRQDRSGAPAITRQLIALSGPALIVFAITVSFAAVDWIMSLDAHWYSTIFGVYYFAGCLIGCFAFMILIAAAMTHTGYLRGVVTVEHFHDLGKLLFAFTVFWSYIAFSQFFLIWYANIPEETVWYLHRLEGGWRDFTIFLAVAHFGVPFLFLMPRTIKRRTGLLVTGALWMLAVHYLDLYWLIMPNLQHHGPHWSLLDLTTLVGVGGLFLAALGWVLRGRALVPVQDPRLVESLSFHNF